MSVFTSGAVSVKTGTFIVNEESCDSAFQTIKAKNFRDKIRHYSLT